MSFSIMLTLFIILVLKRNLCLLATFLHKQHVANILTWGMYFTINTMTLLGLYSPWFCASFQLLDGCELQFPHTVL